MKQLATFAVLLLTACSGLRSNTPVSQIYLLQPALTAPADAAQRQSESTASLAVVVPVVAPGLDSERISLVQPDGRLDYYAGSRWPENLPAVLQPLIVDALRAAGHYRTVQTDTGPFNTEYLLKVEVRQFAVVYDAAAQPVARIVVVCSLGRRADRTALRSFTLSHSEPATANRMGAVIMAFNQALGATLQELVAMSDAK